MIYVVNELQTADKTVGLKQSIKKIKSGTAKKVFIAKDAAPSVTSQITDECEKCSIQIEWVASMSELGRACGIDVGAAVAVVY